LEDVYRGSGNNRSAVKSGWRQQEIFFIRGQPHNYLPIVIRKWYHRSPGAGWAG